MKFSVVASFTGVLSEDYDDGRYRSDCDLDDVVRLCKQHKIPFDLTDVGDSEYEYLSWESPDEPWFQHLRDLTICEFMTRSQFKAFIDDLGAFAEDCLTLGTLGGPLGLGCVPDIPMRMVSSQLIESVRVTPCPEVHGEPINFDYEDPDKLDAAWERIRGAFIAAYS